MEFRMPPAGLAGGGTESIWLRSSVTMKSSAEMWRRTNEEVAASVEISAIQIESPNAHPWTSAVHDKGAELTSKSTPGACAGDRQ
mmetsp:Transcript_48815/g.88248  ORF Transcript_48815/g.88248 Transcript_48815/m.88248 type:complete len:85 (-) Transcript_48815:26-280(-)